MVREAGFRLQINTTVHAGNVNELPDLFAWLIGQHVSLWSVFQLVPTGRGATMRPLEADETEDLLHWLHQIGDLLPIKTTEAPHFRRVAVQRAAATRRHTARRSVPARRAPAKSDGTDGRTYR